MGGKSAILRHVALAAETALGATCKNPSQSNGWIIWVNRFECNLTDRQLLLMLIRQLKHFQENLKSWSHSYEIIFFMNNTKMWWPSCLSRHVSLSSRDRSLGPKFESRSRRFYSLMMLTKKAITNTLWPLDCGMNNIWFSTWCWILTRNVKSLIKIWFDVNLKFFSAHFHVYFLLLNVTFEMIF